MLSTLILASNIGFAFINPPEPATCSEPGWLVEYPSTGQVIRMKRGVYYPDALILEIVPVSIDECIFISSFEEN